jgi:RNA polymerase sigma factor (sigma-70 family)
MADQDPSLILIDKIQQGIDVEESHRQLFDLHYRKVLNYFRRKGFPPEESRDLTQDVFSRVFKAIDTFRRESRFERWLFEIQTNVFRNAIRSKRAEKRDAPEVSIDSSPEVSIDSSPEVSIDSPPEGDEAPGSVLDLVSNEKTAFDSMVERERLVRLHAAIQRLPRKMRTCCELRYVRGLKYREIASVMKIPIETVKAHLSQSSERLREVLAPQAVDGLFATSSERPRIASQPPSRKEAYKADHYGQPQEEELLLAKIRNAVPPPLAARYQELIEKRRAEELTPVEYSDLLRLGAEVEELDVERLQNLIDLARLRGVSLERVVKDLDLEPSSDA